MTIEEKIVEKLTKRGMRVSAGESCTGGMFISSLIGVSGASAVIDASFVTYSNIAKINLLGVEEQTIKKYTEVSEQVAAEMAEGAARVSGADIGVGITGYVGPSGAKVGTVCFGFHIGGLSSTVKVFFTGDRNSIRKQATSFALNTLYNFIK